MAKVIGVTVAAAVGGFLFGFDSSVVNGAVDSIGDHFELNHFMKGFAVAIALLGCALGAWFAGRLADIWGRKKVMLLGSALFIVSSIGTGLAFSVPDLLFWRVIGGLGHRYRLGDRARPTSPRSPRPATAVHWDRCSNWPSPWAYSWPCSPTRCSPTAPAVRPTTCGSASRPGAGCSSSASIPALVYGLLRADDPGVTALSGGQQPRRRSRAHSHRGDGGGRPAGACQRDPADPQTRIDRVHQGHSRSVVWSASAGVGGYLDRRTATVRRYQRDLLLLDHAVAVGRIQRESSRSRPRSSPR